MVNIINVNLLRLASNFQYGHHLHTIAHTSTDDITFISYNESFVNDILGPNVASQLIADEPYDAFHEAGALVRHIV